jgi:hypothetical protein
MAGEVKPGTDARVFFLERTVERHDETLKELCDKVQKQELVTQAIPEIKDTLKEVLSEVRNLNECKIGQENRDKGKKDMFKDNLWWIKELFVLALGAVVVVLWLSAMHLQIGAGP